VPRTIALVVASPPAPVLGAPGVVAPVPVVPVVPVPEVLPVPVVPVVAPVVALVLLLVTLVPPPVVLAVCARATELVANKAATVSAPSTFFISRTIVLTVNRTLA